MAASVDHLVDCGFLVPGACHDVFVILGDVTAQNRGGLLGLPVGEGGEKEKEVRRGVADTVPGS